MMKAMLLETKPPMLWPFLLFATTAFTPVVAGCPRYQQPPLDDCRPCKWWASATPPFPCQTGARSICHQGKEIEKRSQALLYPGRACVVCLVSTRFCKRKETALSAISASAGPPRRKRVQIADSRSTAYRSPRACSLQYPLLSTRASADAGRRWS